MYLRRYERGKNGKKHSYWALVESYRTGRGSRQRIVAYLGELKPSEQNGWTGDNFAGWCFRDANRAIREAVTTLDPQQRKAAYLRQQQLWSQELPSLPLFQRLSLALVAPGVRGPQPDPLAPITWNIAAWKRTK